jgi:hypothetical protein
LKNLIKEKSKIKKTQIIINALLKTVKNPKMR